MSWKTVAAGTSLSDLESMVADMELTKGTRVRVIMEAGWWDWLFNAAGAELVFGAYVPEGMEMVDVWGEDGQGIVEMKADPAWLLAVLAFISAHWVAIAIAGIVVATIVAFCYVMILIVSLMTGSLPWLLGGSLLLVGVWMWSKRARSPTGR